MKRRTTILLFFLTYSSYCCEANTAPLRSIQQHETKTRWTPSTSMSFWSSFMQFLHCPLGPLGHKCAHDSPPPNDSKNNSLNKNSSGSSHNNQGNNNISSGGGSNSQNMNNNNSQMNGGGSSSTNGGGSNTKNGSSNYNGGSSNGSGSGGSNANIYYTAGGSTNYNGGTDTSYNREYDSTSTGTAAAKSSSNHAFAWTSVAVIGSVLGIGVAFALLKKPVGHVLTGSVGKRKGLFERTFLNNWDSSPNGDFSSTDYVRAGPLV